MPKENTQPTDANDLLGELRRLYWESVQTEAQNMIEFYAELRRSEDLDLQPQMDLDLCCESFKKIFDVWTGCQSSFDIDSTADLYAETIEAAKAHLTTPKTKDEWAARLILQASGLLDLDVVYEPTNGSQRYVNVQQNQPNVEQANIIKDGKSVHVVRGVTCSQCQLLIKSPAFYECESDCKSYCFYELVPGEPGSVVFHDDTGTAEDEADYPYSKYFPPYRVCSVCMSTAKAGPLYGCDLDHLREVTYNEPNIEGLPALRSKLIKAELRQQKERDLHTNPSSKKKGSQTAATKFIEKALESTEGLWPADPRLFVRTVGLMTKGHYPPSGNFHLSLMFGPLIFESGLPDINHGVLISPRPTPAFFSDCGVGDVDDALRMKKWPFFYWDRHTKKPCRGVKADENPSNTRPILACLKRVYSAAFSGYPESARLREAVAVQRLIELGDEYKALDRGKEALQRRSRLSELAQDLRCSLETCLGTEVDKHLSRIARILIQRKDRGEWSLLLNNCQLLVNLLLSGDDFEYVIPLPPKDLREESYRWPRYLVSFGNHIEGFGKSLYQPNCLLTQFNQSRPTVDYDLLEFIGRCGTGPSQSHSKAFADLCLSPLANLSREAQARLLETLWVLPGDSLSLLQFHLFRPPQKYHIGEKEWMQNRLCVMQLLSVLATFMSALGNALHRRLVARDSGRDGESPLLSRVTIPPARILGNVRADERLRVLDQLGSRLTVYDIVGRTPNAMSPVVENPARFWKKVAGAQGDDDPVHGEEVVSRIVGWFVAPISAVSPAVGAAIGGSFRLHEDFWIAINVGAHTYVRQYLCKKTKRVRAIAG